MEQLFGVIFILLFLLTTGCLLAEYTGAYGFVKTVIKPAFEARKWRQVHLRTAMVLMIEAGVMLGGGIIGGRAINDYMVQQDEALLHFMETRQQVPARTLAVRK